MAGIGFELRRVISRGRLSTSLNAALSGIMIVAGPWLLTILTVFAIRQSFETVSMVHSALFQVAVIYSYAFSISLFSGLHFLFTRLVADLIWVKDERTAAGWLVWFSAAALVLSAALAWAVLGWIPLPDVGHPFLFRVSTALLFTAVNLLWLVMLFISLLKQYGKILAVYLGGMACAVGLVVWWGSLFGVGGAVLGFATGHLAIVAALLFLCLKEFPPRWDPEPLVKVLAYGRKFWPLILSGFLFYSGQWADKIFFWFTRGTPVEGSVFRLFPEYDLPVYLAGLTIIPGLVYFVIFLETAFYSSLCKFMNGLATDTYAQIQRNKFLLVRTLDEELRDQAVFQGIFTAAAAALAYWLLPGASPRLVVLAMAGSYFLLLLMTLLNLLYYIELFWQALVSTVVFMATQVAFSALGAWYPSLWPGAGFLGASALACAVSYGLLKVSIRAVDRRIFLRPGA